MRQNIKSLAVRVFLSLTGDTDSVTMEHLSEMALLYQMVMLPVTSLDTERSRSWPRYYRMQITWGSLDIEPRFQWGTNSKWHIANRMVMWSMTTCDLVLRRSSWYQYVGGHYLKNGWRCRLMVTIGVQQWPGTDSSPLGVQQRLHCTTDKNKTWRQSLLCGRPSCMEQSTSSSSWSRQLAFL